MSKTDFMYKNPSSFAFEYVPKSEQEKHFVRERAHFVSPFGQYSPRASGSVG